MLKKFSTHTRMQCLVDDLLKTASGSLSIGASFTFGEYVLPHLIAKLKQQYPMITPTVTIGNTQVIAEMVMNHHLDIGILEGDFSHEKLYIEAFAEDFMFAHRPSKPPLCKSREYPIIGAV